MVRWAKRIGWAGFLFFTLKGIAWLVVLAVAWSLRACGE